MAELHLWRVADPAAGSGYVESLTTELCDRAWDEFQTIEKAGGIVEALRAGLVQARLAEARQRAAERIADGKRSILGVTAFANPVEPAPDTEARNAVTPRPRMAAAILIEPVPASRRAEAFEAKAATRVTRMSRIPDFTTLPFAARDTALARGHRMDRAGRHRDQARLSRRGCAGLAEAGGLSGPAALHARALCDHVC